MGTAGLSARSQALLGAGGVLLASGLALGRVEPFVSWYYCAVWWATIVAVDGVTQLRGRPSLLRSRQTPLWVLVGWSTTLWFAFELANLRLQNWSYVGVPANAWERWPGSVLAFGTVLPGLFVWAGLLDTLPWLRRVSIRGRALPAGSRLALLVGGALLTLVSLAWPSWGYPLIWVGPTLALAGLDALLGPGSLLVETLVYGRLRRLLVLLAAGAVCGLLWELYNVGAGARWLYTVPGFERLKLFEMPLLGFLGFPPFAVECYLFARVVGRLRGQPLWDFSLRPWPPRRLRTGRQRAAVAAMCVAICVAGLIGLETRTIWSQRPLVSNAEFLAPVQQARLRAAGWDDLAQVSRAAPVRVCAVLGDGPRPCGELLDLIGLASHRGLGLEGLRLLRAVDVTSLEQLARQPPGCLHARLQTLGLARVPRASLWRLWVRDARGRTGARPRVVTASAGYNRRTP